MVLTWLVFLAWLVSGSLLGAGLAVDACFPGGLVAVESADVSASG
jgi:hypothetical protein